MGGEQTALCLPKHGFNHLEGFKGVEYFAIDDDIPVETKKYPPRVQETFNMGAIAPAVLYIMSIESITDIPVDCEYKFSF